MAKASAPLGSQLRILVCCRRVNLGQVVSHATVGPAGHSLSIDRASVSGLAFYFMPNLELSELKASLFAPLGARCTVCVTFSSNIGPFIALTRPYFLFLVEAS